MDDIHVSKELTEFHAAMQHKLAKNKHKDRPDIGTVPLLTAGLLRELAEFMEEFDKDGEADTEEKLYELADVANFAFLMYFAMKRNSLLETDNVNK